MTERLIFYHVSMEKSAHSLWKTLESLQAEVCHEQSVLDSKAGEFEVQEEQFYRRAF